MKGGWDDTTRMKQMNKILDQEAVRIIYSEKSEIMGEKNSWENIIKQYNSHFVKAEDKLKMVKKDNAIKI